MAEFDGFHGLDAGAEAGDLNTEDGVQCGFVDPFVFHCPSTRVRRTIRLCGEDTNANTRRSRWGLERVVKELLERISWEMGMGSGRGRGRGNEGYLSGRRHTNRRDGSTIRIANLGRYHGRRNVGVNGHGEW